MDSADIVNRLSQIPEVDGDDPIPAYYQDDDGILYAINSIFVLPGRLIFSFKEVSDEDMDRSANFGDWVTREHE